MRGIEPYWPRFWVLGVAILAFWMVTAVTNDSPAQDYQGSAASAGAWTPAAGELPPAYAPPSGQPKPGESTEMGAGEDEQVVTTAELAKLQSVFPATPYEPVAVPPASRSEQVRGVGGQMWIPERAFTGEVNSPPPLGSLNTATGSTAGTDLPFVPAASQFSANETAQPGNDFGPIPANQDTTLTMSPVAAPWWQNQIKVPLRQTSAPRPVSINGLVAAALQYSSQVRVISDTPLIRDTAIIEADSAFDWRTFMETAWNDRNEPVGSRLTTGGPSRFRDMRVDYDLGLRRKLGTGGQFEVSQKYGYEQSNSVFFVPNNQGTSRLTLNYTQPLLRGAGRGYSTSLIVLAQIDSAIARDDFSRLLQEHLLEVTRAYWSLYLERANLLQRQRLFERGQEVLDELSQRESIDAVSNQIVRARAAVAARRSDLFRAAAAVKNSEGRIRALVNAPELGTLDEFELMPTDMPSTDLILVDLRESLEVAVRKRPELNVALKQIKGSAVRLDMSKNELLPVLDVVLETYFAGLSGNSSIGSAWENQYSVGGPSYTAGLKFEVPLRNRESRARFQRRAIELRQFENQFRNTIHALQLEVEIAVREVETSYRELAAKYEALVAAQAELEFIKNRWELLPGEDRTASLVLEDMLAAQERLASVEFDFANTAVTYNLSLTNLKRAMGTLLECEQVSVDKVDECGIPSITMQKGNGTAVPEPAPPVQWGPG